MTDYERGFADGIERAAKVCEDEICACCWNDEAQAAAEHLAETIRSLRPSENVSVPRNLLEAIKLKLSLYRRRDAEYVGGMEYSAMMEQIDRLLAAAEQKERT